MAIRPENMDLQDLTSSKSPSLETVSKSDTVVIPVDSKEEPTVTSPPEKGYVARLWEIFWSFLPLGYTTFGGPQAHIAVLQQQFVDKRDWLDTQMFAELFSLGSFMPGPTSTQVVIALGAVRGGYLGSAISYAMFQTPGFIVMTLAGLLASNYITTETLDQKWLRYTLMGLTAAAIALIAIAAYSLGAKLCKTRLLKLLCILSASIAIYSSPYPWSYPIILAVSGLITILFENWERYKKRRHQQIQDVAPSTSTAAPNPQVTIVPQKQYKAYFTVTPVQGAMILSLFIFVLILAILLRKFIPDVRAIQIFESFYRVGSYIYGGGQVVLPLLLTEVVVPGWVTEEQYFAGFALQQALPGPLFNFSAYLGAIALGKQYGSLDIGRGILGALIAWFGLFAPGIFLILGMLPFWKKFRNIQIIRDAMGGINASSIGLIVAAVFLLWTRGIYTALRSSNNGFMVISILAFGACFFFNIPPPIAIPVGGLLGYLSQFIGVDMAIDKKVLEHLCHSLPSICTSAAAQVS